MRMRRRRLRLGEMVVKDEELRETTGLSTKKAAADQPIYILTAPPPTHNNRTKRSTHLLTCSLTLLPWLCQKHHSRPAPLVRLSAPSRGTTTQKGQAGADTIVRIQIEKESRV